jgi:hypothetical protein
MTNLSKISAFTFELTTEQYIQAPTENVLASALFNLLTDEAKGQQKLHLNIVAVI